LAKRAIGIDVGGTGIKAAIVDTKSGELLSERFRMETPAGGEPEDIAMVVREIVDRLEPKPSLAAGVCFPAVVRHGFTQSAANVSEEWIGLNAHSLFEAFLGRHVHVINDADAAGAAEMKFGAGKGAKGLTIMTTLGTGIGSALFYNGVLIPNSELGHLEIGGLDAEQEAAFSAMEREGLSFQDWAKRLERYYKTLERLFSPDLIIVGGGISKSHQEFLPLINIDTEIVPAKTKNSAGIIGAASIAYRSQDN
jgi:polyphosphate glucokinase